jgi:uncharacterized protein (TIGR02001 family)
VCFAKRRQPNRRGDRAALVTAAALCVLTSVAVAADESSLEWHPRIAVVSNYISRGITQTWGGPAVQGEVEVEHESGVYAGAFASNVSQKQYPGAVLEADAWLGYEYELAKGRSLGVEIIGYLYPGANVSKGNQCGPPCPNQSFNTALLRAFVNVGGVMVRAGYSLTDYFGESTRTGFEGSTRGTWYFDANLDQPLPWSEQWHALAHAGYTRYPVAFVGTTMGQAPERPDYWDFRLGLARDFDTRVGEVRLGLFYAFTSNRSIFQDTRSATSSETRDLARPTVFLEAALSF